MTRVRPTYRALATLLGTASLVAGTTIATGSTAAAAASAELTRAPLAVEESATPLTVDLSTMSPAVVPSSGAVTMTGLVTNDSDDAWTDINVSPFVSSTPITTRDELAEATRTESATSVGERLGDPRVNVLVGDLGPGQSAPFSLRVPRSVMGISGDPGVYWIGVHALGTDADGRDLVADGRARTFIPLVTPARARSNSVPVSVVLPLRDRARRADDGSLNAPARWAGLTGPDGRLTRLFEFGASAGTAPLTWLVDPAVVDAVDDYSRGNPPLSLAPEAEDPGEEDPDASPSPSPTPTPVAGEPDIEERADADAALQTFLRTARTNDLLTLGYSDPDVVALARRRPSLLARARSLAARRLEARGLTGTAAVAPPNGYFDESLISRIPESSVLLLGDGGKLDSVPLSRLPSGQELVLSDDRAGTGGPSPAASDDPLALRQRVLSEAALELEKGTGPIRRIVLQLPDAWDPGPQWRQADFFGELQTPWVRVVPLRETLLPAHRGELAYGPEQRTQEVPDENIEATQTLVRTAVVLDDLLAGKNAVRDRLTGAAFQASSYAARPRVRLAADQVLSLEASTQDEMDGVEVTGTDFVTLSGGSGSLTVTLVNGLDQPITVGLRASADSSEVQVVAPDPVNMGAGQRTTVRLRVNSTVGVHEIRVSPVTSKGFATGTPLTFSLRTSQVGRLIWYVLLAGAVLLAVMIVRRIVLRVRTYRADPGSEA